MRLLVALDLDEAIRERVARFLEGVREFAQDARWVRAESLHVTLKFIGEQPEEAAEKIQIALGKIGARAFELRFGGYGFFPSPGAARVFWVGIAAGPELATLAASVDHALVEIGLAREEHMFSPHLTLARGGSGSGAPRRRGGDRRNSQFQHLIAKLGRLPAPDFGEMTARAFFLYQSRLGPGGARYNKLAEFPLTPQA